MPSDGCHRVRLRSSKARTSNTRFLPRDRHNQRSWSLRLENCLSVSGAVFTWRVSSLNIGISGCYSAVSGSVPFPFVWGKLDTTWFFFNPKSVRCTCFHSLILNSQWCWLCNNHYWEKIPSTCLLPCQWSDWTGDICVSMLRVAGRMPPWCIHFVHQGEGRVF